MGMTHMYQKYSSIYKRCIWSFLALCSFLYVRRVPSEDGIGLTGRAAVEHPAEPLHVPRAAPLASVLDVFGAFSAFFLTLGR